MQIIGGVSFWKTSLQNFSQLIRGLSKVLPCRPHFKVYINGVLSEIEKCPPK